MTCRPPRMTSFTTRYTCDRHYNVDSQCTMSCIPGYVIPPNTPSIMTCAVTGQWIGAEPFHCIRPGRLTEANTGQESILSRVHTWVIVPDIIFDLQCNYCTPNASVMCIPHSLEFLFFVLVFKDKFLLVNKCVSIHLIVLHIVRAILHLGLGH